MKIVILDGFATNPGDLSWAPFEELGRLVIYDRTTSAEAVERIGDADILVVNKTRITAEIMDCCPTLRLISVLGTGYNTIDTEAAKARGIVVCNVPAYSTESVAQHTMALLLEICLHVGAHDESVHAGKWVSAPDYCFWNTPLIELSGKTMGLIGFGNIGQRVAQLSAAFGMNVLYHSRTRRPECESAHIHFAPLEQLLAESDVISLHCPLTPDTEGLIGEEALGRMKKGAILLNTTRGAVLDEAAVAAALHSGALYGAGVDVLSSEPPRADNPLLAAPRCIITPHIAWAPFESRGRLVAVSLQNVKRFLEGQPQNVVNP